VSEEDVALARKSIDLWVAGDRDAAWALWSEDCVGYPPRDWPEPGPFRGRQALRDVFNSWNVAFGEDWTSHMTVENIHDLGEGRVLLEFGFKTSGVESGLPVDQKLASIFTVRDAELVRADYFMTHEEARKAAGVK
jgi:ketosteroid isomerase-like protein